MDPTNPLVPGTAPGTTSPNASIPPHPTTSIPTIPPGLTVHTQPTTQPSHTTQPRISGSTQHYDLPGTTTLQITPQNYTTAQNPFALALPTPSSNNDTNFTYDNFLARPREVNFAPSHAAEFCRLNPQNITRAQVQDMTTRIHRMFIMSNGNPHALDESEALLSMANTLQPTEMGTILQLFLRTDANLPFDRNVFWRHMALQHGSAWQQPAQVPANSNTIWSMLSHNLTAMYNQLQGVRNTVYNGNRNNNNNSNRQNNSFNRNNSNNNNNNNNFNNNNFNNNNNFRRNNNNNSNYQYFRVPINNSSNNFNNNNNNNNQNRNFNHTPIQQANFNHNRNNNNNNTNNQNRNNTPNNNNNNHYNNNNNQRTNGNNHNNNNHRNFNNGPRNNQIQLEENLPDNIEQIDPDTLQPFADNANIDYDDSHTDNNTNDEQQQSFPDNENIHNNTPGFG